MAKNVGTELKLEAIGCLHAPGRSHNAGVVDKQVQRAMLRDLRCGKMMDGSKGSEVKDCELGAQARRIRFHAGKGCFASSLITAPKDDVSTLASEL
ncbi:hypothetical protein HDF12_000626 [Edaphobacter lichenicola]|uniref:Uncharacterized protein n=1 Tax=Tunturiibacter lichenicola TaxID=2051959 RepID=A0A7Y9T1P6_9BACT|nr:hypothetical protein [Edaphobacter lichenicola]